MEKEKASKDIVRQIEKDIYTEAGIFDCCDNDQISIIEQGFMHGYISASA